MEAGVRGQAACAEGKNRGGGERGSQVTANNVLISSGEGMAEDDPLAYLQFYRLSIEIRPGLLGLGVPQEILWDGEEILWDGREPALLSCPNC